MTSTISISEEWLDLTVALFATTYGLDWHAAAQHADALLPDLLAYAAAWDAAGCRACGWHCHWCGASDAARSSLQPAWCSDCVTTHMQGTAQARRQEGA